MENPSPKEEGRGKESTGAGPSGTRDGDDSPIHVQGDNISNPPEFTNENIQLDPSTPRTYRRDVFSNEDFVAIIELARANPRSQANPRYRAFASPPGSPPGFQQYGSLEIRLPAQAFHAGPSFPPGSYYHPRMLPHHRAQFPPGHHPSGYYYYAQPQGSMPHNVQSPPQGIHHQPGILPPSRLVQNPQGHYYYARTQGSIPHNVQPHRLVQNPQGHYYYARTQGSIPHNVQSPPQGHLRGFPLHGQAHGNRPTLSAAARPFHPQSRRGGRTASIPQMVGRGRGHHWRASHQTVAVHRPEPLFIPSGDDVVRPIGRECPVCERDLAFPVPGQVYHPGILPTSAMLPCGHLFHADCLEKVTPEGCSENPPPCWVCSQGDET